MYSANRAPFLSAKTVVVWTDQLVCGGFLCLQHTSFLHVMEQGQQGFCDVRCGGSCAGIVDGELFLTAFNFVPIYTTKKHTEVKTNFNIPS